MRTLEKHIYVVTGGRAEYGILHPVLTAIHNSPSLHLKLGVTGGHLSASQGRTVQEIVDDGWTIDDRVELPLDSGDSATHIASAMNSALLQFTRIFSQKKPDIVLVLGDRYEIFSVAQACLLTGTKLAHISGGDSTEGAIDEAIRHSITKMAHLHFVTNTQAYHRVCQLGENPKNVHITGNPALDRLSTLHKPERGALEERLGFKLRARNLLVTFHPVTQDTNAGLLQLRALLQALSLQEKQTGLIFTMPNADSGNIDIRTHIQNYVDEHDNAVCHESLGQDLYFKTLCHVDGVVGNSSSGLCEAPSFHIPTINIGDRQKGRILASSVIPCTPETQDIAAALERAKTLDCSAVSNPYGDGHASEKIVHILETSDMESLPCQKTFFDLGQS